MRTLIALAIILFASCSGGEKKSPAKKEQGKTFLFYPLPNIYFDQDNREYYFFDSTKSNWQTSSHLPAGVDPSLGKSVILTDVPVPVYRKNEEHRLIHGTVLYSSPDELQDQYIKDSIAGIPKKDTVVQPEEPKKKRTKIGELLRKVFRRKD